MTINLSDESVFTIAMALSDMVTAIDNDSENPDDGDEKLKAEAKALLETFLPASHKVKFF